MGSDLHGGGWKDISVDVVTTTGGRRLLGQTLASMRWLRGLSVATLVMNIVIVITGGLVRLTSSGLGCPTWPRCTSDSVVPHGQLGIHGVIEFGNRTLTIILVVIALLTWISTLLQQNRERGYLRKLRLLTFGLGLGIPMQAVIGGISVLANLNPYIVALHLVDSMALVALSVWLVQLTWHIPAQSVSPGRRTLTVITFAMACLTVLFGTVVTGSGPHAGDLGSRRTGLDAAQVAHLHATAAYLLVALTLICLYLIRSRAVLALLAIEGGQVAIGLTQYVTGLPVVLVTLHLLGAASVMAVAANLLFSVARNQLPSTKAPPATGKTAAHPAGTSPGLRT